jgi:hypothetical protein
MGVGPEVGGKMQGRGAQKGIVKVISMCPATCSLCLEEMSRVAVMIGMLLHLPSVTRYSSHHSCYLCGCHMHTARAVCADIAVVCHFRQQHCSTLRSQDACLLTSLLDTTLAY